MKCPVCEQPDLVMSERQGIEIDYCPKCRGVWLDRGELDKIIERANQFEAEQAVQRQTPLPPPPQAQQPYPPRSNERYDDRYEDRGKYYKKKKSFWTELFD